MHASWSGHHRLKKNQNYNHKNTPKTCNRFHFQIIDNQNIPMIKNILISFIWKITPNVAKNQVINTNSWNKKNWPHFPKTILIDTLLLKHKNKIKILTLKVDDDEVLKPWKLYDEIWVKKHYEKVAFGIEKLLHWVSVPFQEIHLVYFACFFTSVISSIHFVCRRKKWKVERDKRIISYI